MKLKIVVTIRFVHPHFGGMEIRQKDFYNLSTAQYYFRKCKSEDENSGGLQNTTIDIVHEI
jgi:hypothetical protein